MKDKEAVEVLQRTFPRMSKSIYSMSKRPDQYGVELTKLAQTLIGMNKRTDKRRKPYRVTFRLTQEDFEQFELARGNDTRQTFCEAVFKNYLGF